MLEHDRLLLRPRPAAPATPPGGAHENPGRTCDIFDPATGGLVGFACRPTAARSWLRWFSRPALEVHEAEDEPLLFTAYRLRGFTPAWDVRDADGHPVGTLRAFRLRLAGGLSTGHNAGGTLIQDRFGRRVAVFERAPGSAAEGRFVDPDGEGLGSLTRSSHGTLLTFAGRLGGEPLTKMLLLAAALTVG
jgi:hypothetical protein